MTKDAFTRVSSLPRWRCCGPARRWRRRQAALGPWLIQGQDLVLPARRLADDGLTAWQEVLTRGYEGLVAKDPASPYVGGRTLSWLKVKQPHYREGERGWEAKGKS